MYLKLILSLFAVSFAYSAADEFDWEYDFPYYHIKHNTRNVKLNRIVKGEKVDIKVYYECMCGGCISFHTGPLDDVLKKIGSYINLKTYPYGNAQRMQENGKTVIKCQHGPDECYGNKLHACAIDILKNVSQSEFYNSCMMKGTWGGRGSTNKDATNCGESMGIDAKPIIECANGKKGEDLLEYYGAETAKVTKEYVPWVLVNGDLLDPGQELMQKVCDALTKPPPPCSENYP